MISISINDQRSASTISISIDDQHQHQQSVSASPIGISIGGLGEVLVRGGEMTTTIPITSTTNTVLVTTYFWSMVVHVYDDVSIK
jgi:hypothetical protein